MVNVQSGCLQDEREDSEKTCQIVNKAHVIPRWAQTCPVVYEIVDTLYRSVEDLWLSLSLLCWSLGSGVSGAGRPPRLFLTLELRLLRLWFTINTPRLRAPPMLVNVTDACVTNASPQAP